MFSCDLPFHLREENHEQFLFWVLVCRYFLIWETQIHTIFKNLRLRNFRSLFQVCTNKMESKTKKLVFWFDEVESNGKGLIVNDKIVMNGDYFPLSELCNMPNEWKESTIILLYKHTKAKEQLSGFISYEKWKENIFTDFTFEFNKEKNQKKKIYLVQNWAIIYNDSKSNYRTYIHSNPRW